MQPRNHVPSPLCLSNLSTNGGANPFWIGRDRDGRPKRPAGTVRRGRRCTRERGGGAEGLCKGWRTREGQPDGNGQGRVGVGRLICRERQGFDASRALRCAAKGERNTARVRASAGNKMGLRTKPAKSAAAAIFPPKLAMVGCPRGTLQIGHPRGGNSGRKLGYIFFSVGTLR